MVDVSDPITIDEKVAAWVGNLETFRGELQTAYVDHSLFVDLDDAIRRSETTSGLWLDHHQRLYFSKQAMFVRRIVIGRQNY